MKTRILLLLLFFIINTKGSASFIVKGTVHEKLNNLTMIIYPLYPHPTDLVKQESKCIIKGGKFEFILEASGIEIYVIAITTIHESYSNVFYLLPRETTIVFKTANLDSYDLIGNDIHFEVLDFNAELVQLQKQDQTPFTLKWIENNIFSVLSPIRLYGLIKHLKDGELKKLYYLMPKENLKNSRGLELTYYIEKLSIDVVAPIFYQQDLNQKLVNLTDYRGKYLLLDFWASWCVPCRAETPYLIKAREKFKRNGFDILSVSLDDNVNLWKEATKKDNMRWDNVSDLKGWKNFVSKSLYKVSSIPANFLLDPSGKIIAKNLRGADLQKKLDEIFIEREH